MTCCLGASAALPGGSSRRSSRRSSRCRWQPCLVFGAAAATIDHPSHHFPSLPTPFPPHPAADRLHCYFYDPTVNWNQYVGLQNGVKTFNCPTHYKIRYYRALGDTTGG